MMPLKRTPPTQSLQNNPNSAAESDAASDYVPSDADCEGKPNITRRFKRKHGDVTLNDIKDMLALLQQQQSDQSLKFQEEMQKMSQQHNEIIQSIQFMSDKYDDISQQLQQTKLENSAYIHKIKTLEQKVELLERNTKASCLELRNVPMAPSETKESLVNMAKNLGLVLNREIVDTEIRNIYRPTKSSSKSTPIIIEFSSAIIKESFIKASKKFNKENKDKINTSHLKVPGELKPVFVSESLTTYGRRLFYLAREYVRKHKCATCWTSYGKVYMRAKEGAPAKLVSHEEEISNLDTQ